VAKFSSFYGHTNGQGFRAYQHVVSNDGGNLVQSEGNTQLVCGAAEVFIEA